MRKDWKIDEFVSYDEYAFFGISGKMLERNMNRSDKLNIPEECRCPFCSKALKEGSYILMKMDTNCSGSSRYYQNLNHEGGKIIKVGLGCYRNLMKAYNKKYKGK